MIVSLRPLKQEDAYISFRWRNDHEVFKHTTAQYDRTISLNDEIHWINRVLSNENELRLAIEADGKYIGNTYFTNIENHRACFHIFIGDKSYWGKGIGSITLSKMLEIGFSQLKLSSIYVDVKKENIRSIRLCEKYGFKIIEDNGTLLKMEKKRPLVSIVSLTYNEEQYVRECLNSFIEQETSFDYEVLIYDDASTDNTPLIIKEYANKYPSIFKTTFYQENNFSKGLGFKGVRDGFSEALGKYIAYCEGDDYWCDKHKLQKQVDFLESHPEFEICAHETMIRDDYNEIENGVLFSSKKVNLFIDRTRKRRFDFYDTLTGNIFHVSSMMFRKFPFNWPSWIGQIRAMDMVCFMLIAEIGDIYVMKDVMSVYRYNPKSITSSNTEFQSAIAFNNASIEILEKMNVYWEDRYFNAIKKILAGYYTNNMFCYLSKGLRDYSSARTMAKTASKYDFPSFIKYFVIESYRKLQKHLW